MTEKMCKCVECILWQCVWAYITFHFLPTFGDPRSKRDFSLCIFAPADFSAFSLLTPFAFFFLNIEVAEKCAFHMNAKWLRVTKCVLYCLEKKCFFRIYCEKRDFFSNLHIWIHRELMNQHRFFVTFIIHSICNPLIPLLTHTPKADRDFDKTRML